MESAEGSYPRPEEMVGALLAPTVMRRMALRAQFSSSRGDPPSYLAALRVLPPLPFELEPVLCLSPRASPEEALGEEAEELDSEGPSMVRFPFRPLREMPVHSAVDLRHKEVVYLAKRRQALFLLRDYIWAVGTLSLKRVAAERHWGAVPTEIVSRVQESKRNRRDTRLPLKEVWGFWPEPFQQTLEEWDEVYLAEFPEVVDHPERPGSVSGVRFIQSLRGTS